MKKIAELVGHIREELEDAEQYAMESKFHRDEDSQLADVYAQIANDELRHANIWHEQAVKMIQRERNQGHDVPAEMQAIWDWQHKQMIEAEQHVRKMLMQ